MVTPYDQSTRATALVCGTHGRGEPEQRNINIKKYRLVSRRKGRAGFLPDLRPGCCGQEARRVKTSLLPCSGCRSGGSLSQSCSPEAPSLPRHDDPPAAGCVDHQGRHILFWTRKRWVGALLFRHHRQRINFFWGCRDLPRLLTITTSSSRFGPLQHWGARPSVRLWKTVGGFQGKAIFDGPGVCGGV